MSEYIGTIIVAALVVLGVLILLYLLLSRRSRERVPIASVEDEHYLEGEELVRAAGVTFASAPSVGFFGRINVVRVVGTDEHGLCLFPPPALVDEKSCKRYAAYAQAIKEKPIDGLAPVRWWRASHNFIGLIQGELVRRDGHLRMTLREYLLDRTLDIREKEGILFAIAHVLRKLHDGGFYHGWLLPRSLYVILDPSRVIRGIRIADGGLVYAFGPEKIYERLQQLRGRELGMDAYRRHRLLNELVHLSPEQQQRERIKEVGSRSDFYAFGSIAARLFSDVPLYGAAEVDWDKIPEKWQGFLKACLSDNRPLWDDI